MRVSFFYIPILFMFLCNTSFSQSPRKKTVDMYKQIASLPINEIKQGKHLELAIECKLEEFINLYIRLLS